MGSIGNVPNEWNLKDNYKEEIFNFINKRKNIVEKHFDKLLNEIGI